MARRDGASVRLITRNGHDFTSQFPLAAAAVTALPARSFLIDGEAIVTNATGLAVFDLIRCKRHGGDAVLVAFDLIELDGEDLRRSPIEHRKRKLAKLARGPHPGIVSNEHYDGDGDIVFNHACKLGCKGIVSKRLGSSYRFLPDPSARNGQDFASLLERAIVRSNKEREVKQIEGRAVELTPPQPRP